MPNLPPSCNLDFQDDSFTEGWDPCSLQSILSSNIPNVVAQNACYNHIYSVCVLGCKRKRQLHMEVFKSCTNDFDTVVHVP